MFDVALWAMSFVFVFLGSIVIGFKVNKKKNTFKESIQESYSDKKSFTYSVVSGHKENMRANIKQHSHNVSCENSVIDICVCSCGGKYHGIRSGHLLKGLITQ